MRRVWVAGCALALIGAALALSSTATPVGAAAHHARGVVAPRPTPPTRKRPTPVPISAPSPAAQSATTPAPTPTPPPPPQVINVTPTQASPGQNVTVSGSGFPAGTRVQLYLDGPDHPLGPSVVVGSDGTFSSTETVPAGATVDLHQICAQVNTTTPTCAQLQVTAAPTPTPAATPTPASTPATPAPTPVPTAHATPRPATNGLLASLFPWILIPIAVLVALAVLAIVLLVRGRRPKGQAGAPPPPVLGDPRGGGQPTVTHRSPRGYRAPGEPWGPEPRGYYRRQGLSAPPRGEQLPSRGDRPGLREGGYGNPELPGAGPDSLPEGDRPRLPGGRPGSLPPSRRPPVLPPRDGDDDDDPFSTPPTR